MKILDNARLFPIINPFVFTQPGFYPAGGRTVGFIVLIGSLERIGKILVAGSTLLDNQPQQEFQRAQAKTQSIVIPGRHKRKSSNRRPVSSITCEVAGAEAVSSLI